MQEREAAHRLRPAGSGQADLGLALDAAVKSAAPSSSPRLSHSTKRVNNPQTADEETGVGKRKEFEKL